MAHTDRHGVPLDTSSAAAAEHYRQGMERFLTAQPGAPAALARAVAEDPGFVAARTALAMALAYEGRGTDAGAELAAAEERAAGAGRAAAALGAQAALVRRAMALDVEGVWRHGRRYLEDHPTDDVAREAVGSTLYLCGRSDQLRSFLADLSPALGGDWAFSSAAAFAAHETGDLDGARRLADASLAARPGNAFAVHSLAHVAYESGEHAWGEEVLARFCAGYDPAGRQFRHLGWHRALHALATGREDDAVALWRRAVGPGAVPPSATTLEDGAGMLWRWHLMGATGWDPPWHSLADEAQAAAAGPLVPLVAACAALVLAATGDAAGLDRLLAGSAAAASAGAPLPVAVLAAVAAAALASFAGDWGAVADALGPVQGERWRLGGSRAQRQLFEDAWLVGLVLDGRGDQALPVLAARLARRPSDVDSALALVAASPAPGG